ncbi:hypothetical protein BCR34DRAFT_546930 [Clohesyomyces aquaticus]|uniref:Rhodopsin domain-containing protein n=1 Tax=Clohesyomyces aquaticus TaxID=1231657 RepID=A0A1Y1YQN0_9PLEO|nr:hypothetical protein BCR34DRAFT_546930 [Clohesyomyces aquaticus]
MAPIQARADAHGSGESDTTLAVSGLIIVLAVISCALRFYTRIFTKSGLKSDDWFILVAVLATLLTAALLLWGNAIDQNGLWVSENTDPTYVYTEQDILYLKIAFVASVIYFTIAGTTKLGILLMYNRIFNVSDSFRWQLYIASALVMGWWIGCTVATLTNCIPLEWSWINSFADPRYCFDFNIFWTASGACEIFLDVLILTLPISVVVRLSLSLKKKLMVVGIFALGWFAVITGIVRVILGYNKGNRVPSYSGAEVWTTVHAGLSIVCASLPCFKPLVRKIAGLSFLARISSLLSIRRSTSNGSSSKKSSQVDSNNTSLGVRGGERANEGGGNEAAPTALSDLSPSQIVEIES